MSAWRRRTGRSPHASPHAFARRRVWVALTGALSLALFACAPRARIVAFGDVHGDLEATRGALRLAGAIDDQDRWIGGHMIVVQTGDQLDRGDEDRAILDLFERLRAEAAATGGEFHALLGNHELMNASGDVRYVTEGGFAAFADFAADSAAVAADPRLAAFEPGQRGRMIAFLPGGTYARILAGHDVILKIDGNVFVHGGVLPAHVAYGIDRINEEARAWLLGEAPLPEILDSGDSPDWSRLYSAEPDSAACATLAEVLESLDADRMIVGHTVQEGGIASACGGGVWRIDVGLARLYGGPTEVLEIVGDSVRVLRGAGAAR